MGKRDKYWYELSKNGKVVYRTFARVLAVKLGVNQNQIYMAWKRKYRIKGYDIKRLEAPKK